MKSNAISQLPLSFITTLLVSLFLQACIFDAPPGLDPFVDSDPGPVSPQPELRYNEVFRKACHNCYEMQYAESLGEALNYTNSIEIDFWETRDGVGGRKNGKWFVRHDPVTIYASGNDNCCTSGPNGTNDMDACLRNVAAWSEAHPGHEVITIYIDKKDSWSGPLSGRDPAGMDNLVQTVFGEKLFSPSDLKAGYSSPREAAGNNEWPMLSDLRDKVIIGLTGSNGLLNQYANERGDDGMIFVVPKIGSVGEIANPSNFAAGNLQYVVFYNMNYATNDIVAGTEVRNLGAVGRSWGMPETDNAYQNLISKDIHVIALYGFREEGFNGGNMEGGF